MELLIRLGETDKGLVRAKVLGEGRARLLEVPLVGGAELYDVVHYDPASRGEESSPPTVRSLGVAEASGYRGYLTWALLRQPAELERWRAAMREVGIEARLGEWQTGEVRQMVAALPPTLSALEALVRFNRHAGIVEVVSPLLAAHADDLERAKSDLERVASWGAPEAELTLAVAEAFEGRKRWDEAVYFWERLAHMMPTFAAAREHLAISYARLGVFPMAAAEFERAAHLTDDPEHRQQLEAARDLMWERSRL